MEFFCLLVAPWRKRGGGGGCSGGSGGEGSWNVEVSFFHYLVGLSVALCLCGSGAVDLEDGGVHLAWIARFEVGCLGAV